MSDAHGDDPPVVVFTPIGGLPASARSGGDLRKRFAADFRKARP